ERKNGERVGAPGIADLAAEVEAGPGKEWNGRGEDRRRLAGGKVCREGRCGGGQCCRRDEKFANHDWVPFRRSNFQRNHATSRSKQRESGRNLETSRVCDSLK